MDHHYCFNQPHFFVGLEYGEVSTLIFLTVPLCMWRAVRRAIGMNHYATPNIKTYRVL